jgi:hypothetical protein
MEIDQVGIKDEHSLDGRGNAVSTAHGDNKSLISVGRIQPEYSTAVGGVDTNGYRIVLSLRKKKSNRK